MSATPRAYAPSAPGNPAETDQAVPFQCRARPWKLDLFTCVRPTAQASVPLPALTALSRAVLPGVAGVATWDQAVPFQVSMSTLAPTLVKALPLRKPTAQASLSDTVATPVKVAFCPVGGAVTTVQPVAANAALAPRTSAVPAAAAVKQALRWSSRSVWGMQTPPLVSATTSTHWNGS